MYVFFFLRNPESIMHLFKKKLFLFVFLFFSITHEDNFPIILLIGGEHRKKPIESMLI